MNHLIVFGDKEDNVVMLALFDDERRPLRACRNPEFKEQSIGEELIPGPSCGKSVEEIYEELKAAGELEEVPADKILSRNIPFSLN